MSGRTRQREDVYNTQTARQTDGRTVRQTDGHQGSDRRGTDGQTDGRGRSEPTEFEMENEISECKPCMNESVAEGEREGERGRRRADGTQGSESKTNQLKSAVLVQSFGAEAALGGPRDPSGSGRELEDREAGSLSGADGLASTQVGQQQGDAVLLGRMAEQHGQHADFDGARGQAGLADVREEGRRRVRSRVEFVGN